MAPESGNVDELRDRLRALGYLDAGVDRFVVSPAAGRYGAASVAVRISARIGLLAALLLGPAAAIGLAARLPGLISGPRDAAVVTLFLAAVFGAAFFTASAGAAIVIAAAGRRATARTARRMAIAAGTIVGICSLAYLTLWWNATGAVSVAPVRSVLAVAAAVAISLLLGYAITVATLALHAREEATPVRAPAMSWRATLIIALIAFLGASALMARSVVGGGSNDDTRVPGFAVVPTGVRVVVIAIDGFDRRVRDELAAGGSVEHLRTFVTTPGSRVIDTDPARAWTTVATGMTPEEHGVSGIELRRVAGLQGAVGTPTRTAVTISRVADVLRLTRPAAASGRTRHQKMFWEVAADKGLDAAVVNWWATWPAANTRATVMSDRAALRLERGGPQAAEIAPAALYEPLRARWPAIAARAGTIAREGPWSPTSGAIQDALIRSATLDAEQVLVARDPLLRSRDLLAVYLPGLDIAQYALLQEQSGALSLSSLGARVDALRRYYVFLDQLVALIAADQPENTVLVTVTLPGRIGGGAPATLGVQGQVVRHWNGAVSFDFQLADVAPTVLYLLGVPVSRALAGRPLTQLFTDAFVSRFPVRYVDTYGRYVADVPVSEGTPLDKEALERLRSLGYIQR